MDISIHILYGHIVMTNVSLKLLKRKAFYACSLKIVLTSYSLINYRQNTAFHTK